MNPRPPPSEPGAGVDLAHEAAFRLGQTEVRPSTLELVRDGRATTVERKVMQALVVLSRRQGEVTSRDELIEMVWSGRFIGEDAIHRVMAKLRHAAEDQAGGDFGLETVPRVDYRLVVGGKREADPVEVGPSRPSRTFWVGLSAVVALAIGGVAALQWWPQPKPRPPVVRLAELTALGPDVPASLPASLTDDVRVAFGEDNVVILRDRNPDFVLSGTVRRVDDKLRLSVKLNDARDGTMLWSGVRNWPAVRRVSPRFNAVNITQIVRCGLLDGAQLPAHALALYLQYCDARWSGPPQHERSVAIARRLVEAAPRFARGWSSLAWSTYATVSIDPKRAEMTALRTESKTAAAMALSLDPRDAQAYEVQAYQLPVTEYAAQERLTKRATEGRLTACGCEVVSYGGLLATVGRVREAVVQFQRAHQREPVGTHALTLSIGYAAMGDVERSDQAFAKWSEIYADSPTFLLAAMVRATYAGRWSEAARLARIEARPEARVAIVAAFEALASGDPARIADARPGVARAAAAAPNNALFTTFYSMILAALDDRPAALDSLERLAPGEAATLFLPAVVTALRHEPRYLRLLERQGLIKYWRETRTRPDLCSAPDAPAFCKTLG